MRRHHVRGLAFRLLWSCAIIALAAPPTFSQTLGKVYFESPGTDVPAHEWLTWRRCLNDFAPRLFK